MRERDPNPRRRRFVRTTHGDRDGPIHPSVAKGLEAHGPDRLRAADLTRAAVVGGLARAALITDARSRRVVGHAIGRRIDARPAAQAPHRATALRRPPPGRVLHPDRGSRHACELHRGLLGEHGLVGSTSRRGGPRDDPQAEGPMRTLEAEDIPPMERETREDVAAGAPRPIDASGDRRLHPAPGRPSPAPLEDQNAHAPVKAAAQPCPPAGAYSSPPPNCAFLRLFRGFHPPTRSCRFKEIPPCSSVAYPATHVRGDVAERSKALPC